MGKEFVNWKYNIHSNSQSSWLGISHEALDMVYFDWNTKSLQSKTVYVQNQNNSWLQKYTHDETRITTRRFTKLHLHGTSKVSLFFRNLYDSVPGCINRQSAHCALSCYDLAISSSWQTRFQLKCCSRNLSQCESLSLVYRCCGSMYGCVS